MIDTEQNRRCSFLMHLYDLLSIYGKNINCPDTLRSYGVFNEVNEIVDFLNSVGARDKSSFLDFKRYRRIIYFIRAFFVNIRSNTSYQVCSIFTKLISVCLCVTLILSKSSCRLYNQGSIKCAGILTVELPVNSLVVVP